MAETSTPQSLLINGNPMNQSVEHMVGAIVGYRSTLEIMKKRYEHDAEQTVRIDECEVKLKEAERAVLPDKWWKRRKIFAAWNLLHQVSEEFFLLLTWEELLAEGRKLHTDMTLSSIPSAVKQAWQTEIKKCLDDLEKDLSKKPDPLSPATETDPKKHACRQTLKMGMNTMNTQMDTLFWDVWTKKFFTMIYTLMLLLLLLGLYYRFPCSPPDTICLDLVFLLGAIGGVASGIMTAEPMYLSKGHFWVSALYYFFSRPVQGALAALIMFWMIQSQYLIKIEPPIKKAHAITAAAPSVPHGSGARKAAPAEPAFTAMTSGASQVQAKSSGGAALVVLNAADGQQIYLYMLVLLIAGFTGDKLLKTVSDKVTSKLFTEAEKTKESKNAK